MKKIILFCIALLPLAVFASGGPKEKNQQKVNIHISVDKKGKVAVSGLGKDLKELESKINEALKDLDIQIEDGKKKHDLHFRAKLKIK